MYYLCRKKTHYKPCKICSPSVAQAAPWSQSDHVSFFFSLALQVAGERYVYKFVCDPEALFSMAFPDNQRPVLKTDMERQINEEETVPLSHYDESVAYVQDGAYCNPHPYSEGYVYWPSSTDSSASASPLKVRKNSQQVWKDTNVSVVEGLSLVAFLTTPFTFNTTALNENQHRAQSLEFLWNLSEIRTSPDFSSFCRLRRSPGQRVHFMDRERQRVKATVLVTVVAPLTFVSFSINEGFEHARFTQGELWRSWLFNTCSAI